MAICAGFATEKNIGLTHCNFSHASLKGHSVLNSPELLDQALILGQIEPQARNQLKNLVIEASLDSTNSALQRLPTTEQHGTAILAEHQTAGRGRLGRPWHSPAGGNLYMSLGWCFRQSLAGLGCLPLVVALSAAQALTRSGMEKHRVKWPNDLMLDGKKLCGCLVEVQGSAREPSHAVLGVGINIRMPAEETAAEISQPWTDLSTHLPDCSRNSLAALLLEELIVQLSLFAEKGFAPFMQQWEKMDGLKGHNVDVAAGNRMLHGIVTGIDQSGALLLDTGSEMLSLRVGEVSIMAACSA